MLTPDAAPLDTRPLTAPVPEATAEQYAAQLQASGFAPQLPAPAGRAPSGVGLVAMLVICGIVTLLAAARAWSSRDWETGMLAACAACFAAFMLLGSRHRRTRRTASVQKWYRLGLFAGANGLVYWPWATPPVRGALFRHPRTGKVTDLVTATRPGLPHGPVLLGNYSFCSNDDDESHRHAWGFAVLPLDGRWRHELLREPALRRGSSKIPHTDHWLPPQAMPAPGPGPWSSGPWSRAVHRDSPAARSWCTAERLHRIAETQLPLAAIEVQPQRLLLVLRLPAVSLNPELWLQLDTALDALRR